MLRDVNLDEISDGKLYGINDMVKADCGGCLDCSDCCHGMGTSIVLDPLDMHRLSTGLNQSFEQLMTGPIELNVVDGIILPNLKMSGTNEACSFLDSDERCSIHAFRPGICRIFPLGRFYEERSFRYFLQIHECPKPNKTKVKIRKWIDTANSKNYEQYISDWHFYLKDLQEQASTADAETIKKLSMEVLTRFYIQPYDTEKDFYEQFYMRMK